MPYWPSLSVNYLKLSQHQYQYQHLHWSVSKLVSTYIGTFIGHRHQSTPSANTFIVSIHISQHIQRSSPISVNTHINQNVYWASRSIMTAINQHLNRWRLRQVNALKSKRLIPPHHSRHRCMMAPNDGTQAYLSHSKMNNTQSVNTLLRQHHHRSTASWDNTIISQYQLVNTNIDQLLHQSTVLFLVIITIDQNRHQSASPSMMICTFKHQNQLRGWTLTKSKTSHNQSEPSTGQPQYENSNLLDHLSITFSKHVY